jgi:hypothetical protein
VCAEPDVLSTAASQPVKGKRDHNIAIDLILIPYHGQPYQDKKEIVRGAPKSGTTHFHGYATISIVHDDRHFVVALRFVEYGEEMAEIVRWLIKRVKSRAGKPHCESTELFELGVICK